MCHNITVITVAQYWLFRCLRCMVTISCHNIAIGIQYDLVTGNVHAMTKLYFIFHKTFCGLKMARYRVILTCMNRMCCAGSTVISALFVFRLCLNLKWFWIFMPWSLQKQEPISIQSHSSLPSIIFPDQPLQAETSSFSKENSFLLCSANESDAGGKLRNINLQSSSPKHKARLSLIKSLVWIKWQNGLHRKRNCVTEFRPKRVCFVSLGRSTWEWIWRRFVSWTVVLWYTLFHVLWM